LLFLILLDKQLYFYLFMYLFIWGGGRCPKNNCRS